MTVFRRAPSAGPSRSFTGAAGRISLSSRQPGASSCSKMRWKSRPREPRAGQRAGVPTSTHGRESRPRAGRARTACPGTARVTGMDARPRVHWQVVSSCPLCVAGSGEPGVSLPCIPASHPSGLRCPFSLDPLETGVAHVCAGASDSSEPEPVPQGAPDPQVFSRCRLCRCGVGRVSLPHPDGESGVRTVMEG